MLHAKIIDTSKKESIEIALYCHPFCFLINFINWSFNKFNAPRKTAKAAIISKNWVASSFANVSMVSLSINQALNVSVPKIATIAIGMYLLRINLDTYKFYEVKIY